MWPDLSNYNVHKCVHYTYSVSTEYIIMYEHFPQIISFFQTSKWKKKDRKKKRKAMTFSKYILEKY